MAKHVVVTNDADHESHKGAARPCARRPQLRRTLSHRIRAALLLAARRALVGGGVTAAYHTLRILAAPRRAVSKAAWGPRQSLMHIARIAVAAAVFGGTFDSLQALARKLVLTVLRERPVGSRQCSGSADAAGTRCCEPARLSTWNSVGAGVSGAAAAAAALAFMAGTRPLVLRGTGRGPTSAGPVVPTTIMLHVLVRAVDMVVRDLVQCGFLPCIPAFAAIVFQVSLRQPQR